MRCPSCGFDNRDAAKFCGECATRLTSVCPGCGADAVPGQRFCDECGTPMSTTPAAERPAATQEIPRQSTPVSERRVVSVLFADLVGFTPLSESRDPEAGGELFLGYFYTPRNAIARHRGPHRKSNRAAGVGAWGAP